MLVVGLLLSAVATRYVQRNVEQAAQVRLTYQADEAVQLLAKRMEAYVATIRSAAALFAASETVTRGEFRHFVDALDLRTTYPGIQGLGFTRVVRGPRGADPRLEGYLVHEPPSHSAIVMIEPIGPRNLQALGYDMFAEPTRRAAMERARDSGQPAASGRVELVQEITPERQAGFLIYVPVYETRQLPPTVEGRRAALIGWVYSPFRTGDLLRGVYGPSLDFEISIYGGSDVDDGRLLYASADAALLETDAVAVRQLQVAGETWTIVLGRAGGLVRGSEALLPPLVLVASALVTLLLFGITWSLVQGREAAEEASARLLASEAERSRLLDAERVARVETEQARQRAAFLADASALLASSLSAPDMLEKLARRAVPFLGDGCAIDLENEQGELTREVVVYRDPALEEWIREAYRGEALTATFAPIIHGVAATGKPAILAEVPDTVPARLPPQLREMGRKLLGSFVVVPLTSREGILGTISFSAEQPGRFGPAEQELAIDLGRRVALAIDNTRLFANAQEAIRVRDDFLSIASHELRTPLTALQAHLQGLLRSLQRELPPPATVETKIETALRQTRRLGKLVNELLDVSRITAGKLHLEREPFDLAELATELAERFREEAQRAGSELVVRAEHGATGRWDRNRIEQVLTNLLSNAIKYGAGEPVELDVKNTGATVCVSVYDRGIGISPEAQLRIFGRFERASSERHYGGLGLGLYITREIVAAHGGQILVKSAPGEGARFLVVLPREAPDRHDAEASPA